MQNALTLLVIVAMFALGVLYLYVGVVGIGIEFGTGWAIAAFIAGMMRFSLPLSLGAFYYASNVWGWGILGSAIFAFPLLGLQLLLITGSLFSTIGGKLKQG